MDKLEASLKTIRICTSLIDKATYTSGYDSKQMLRRGIVAKVGELMEIVKELDKEDE